MHRAGSTRSASPGVQPGPGAVATLVVVLAGCRHAEDVSDCLAESEARFRGVLVLPACISTHDMVPQSLAIAVPAELERVLRTWVEAICAPGALTPEGGHVAFDAKSLRASLDKSLGFATAQMVGAYLIDSGLTLGTVKIDGEAIEITAIPEMVRTLDLEGATVTNDSMGCQAQIAGEIMDLEAD